MNKNSTTIECKDVCDDKQTGTMADQIAQAVCAFQHQTTGHAPKAVTVVLSDDTLVITLHDALTPAERALAKSAHGVDERGKIFGQAAAVETALGRYGSMRSPDARVGQP